MICIIPARGGSKRLPGKNLRKLDGEYIINRVIRIAQESGIFVEIIVSTDSKQIADIVIGADVSMRPPEISGDIPEDRVLDCTLTCYKEWYFCRMYPFAVLLTPERLIKGYNIFTKGEYENVHECQKYGHNPSRAFSQDGRYNLPYGVVSDIISSPTELLTPMYHDAATFMFSTVDALDKPLAERNIKWIPVKETEAQDLDDAEDWEMLSLKWKGRKQLDIC